MRSAIRKLTEILDWTASLYTDFTLSALRIVPARD